MILASGFTTEFSVVVLFVFEGKPAAKRKSIFTAGVGKVTRAPPRRWHRRWLPGVRSDSIFRTLFPQDWFDLVDLLEW